MTKGMILAAGQGSRVRPLTRDLPKPMVPILGKPVMEYLIEQMARHGVCEIMVNVAYHHRKIEDYFGDGSRWGVEIGYSYEGILDNGDILPKPRGSAGGMRHIQDFLMKQRWWFVATRWWIWISVQRLRNTRKRVPWPASLR